MTVYDWLLVVAIGAGAGLVGALITETISRLLRR
jgi:hypothetical protein